MRRDIVALLAVAGFVGCLAPSYSVGTDSTAGAAGATGATGATGGAGQAGSGPRAGASTGGTDAAEAGGPSAAGTATVLPTECNSDQKYCAGQCVALDDVAFGCTLTSCNQSQCPVGALALACEDGKCVVDACATGQKKCGGRCVSVSDPTYGCSADGCDASACPLPQGGTLICDAGSCKIGQCSATTKQCGSNCVPLDATNGCADPDDCAPCAANEECSGSPSSCTCMPDSPCENLDCGSATNRCGETVECEGTCDPGLVCADNQCVQCNTAADCPSIVCASASCTNHQCNYAAAPTTSCPGGTCSSKVGVCSRPQVTVGTFKIDATEVTRAQYLAFLTAKQGSTTGQPATCSWNTSFVPTGNWPPALAQYEMPVNYVDWCDAVAYCSWNGGRLCGGIGGGATPPGEHDVPAKGQWMKACGGASATTFPYGNTFQVATCNVNEIVPVASFPGCVGGYPGLYDMSGNVQEWEDSCYGGYCGLRGSNYDLGILEGGERLRCGAGQVDDPKITHERIGIRCCSSP